MSGKNLVLALVVGTLVMCLVIYLGFQLYFNMNPTQ
jgi:hypothetical protein